MLLDKTLYIPDLGQVAADSGFHLLPATEDGKFVAGKNSVGKSVLDGVGMGLGFTLALMSMAFIREVFGVGTFFGLTIPVLSNYKIEILTKAPGGFMVYGIMIAIVYKLTHGKAPYKKEFSCATCPSAAFCGKAECQAKEEN